MLGFCMINQQIASNVHFLKKKIFFQRVPKDLIKMWTEYPILTFLMNGFI